MFQSQTDKYPRTLWRQLLMALALTASLGIMPVALTGCEEDGAEEAGEEIDEAIDEAGDEIDDALD